MNLTQVNKKFIIQRAKTFFRSKKWGNVLIFLIFLVLAFIFWLLHYYQQKFEIECSLPVQYEQTPPDIVLDSSLPQNINVKIQDKGTVLFNYLFVDKQSIPIHLKDIPHDEKTYTLSRIALNSAIHDGLSSTTQVLSFYPEDITIHYSPLEKKELPVALDGDLQTASGFILTESRLTPSTVFAYGDRQTLETLKEIKTIPVKKSNLRKNLDLTLDLQAPEGVRLSSQEVQLAADIKAYTEKKLELPIVSHHLPKNRYIRFFPSSVEVSCQVDLEKYPQLTAMDLEIGVDYNTLIQNKTTPVVTLVLTKKPPWLIGYRIMPERVEYLIEQKQTE
jgi:hypothetical protein